MDNAAFLVSSAQKIGVSLDDKKAADFISYMELLLSWNEKINLTAITDEHDIIIKHFADSLSALSIIGENSNASVVDVGCGAGFPSIPLKIANPSLGLCLMDSLNKRLLFLDELIKALNLSNIELVHARAEDAGQNEKFRERFDIALSRAVASLYKLSEYCLPLVKTGGLFIAYKSKEPEEEIKEAREHIKELGGEIVEIKKVKISDDITHSLIITKKVRQTPSRFPRKPNKITAQNKF
ncbi:MAG: 16S rRNA (guanine(527)-N(7))-methyltransferase RsmG [Lachnospiraceae bacterium]|nr:16S rRNA (guanine(527)-N(7))-methyltransferase RsmG [Lachnospiraceae bacterium]